MDLVAEGRLVLRRGSFWLALIGITLWIAVALGAGTAAAAPSASGSVAGPVSHSVAADPDSPAAGTASATPSGTAVKPGLAAGSSTAPGKSADHHPAKGSTVSASFETADPLDRSPTRTPPADSSATGPGTILRSQQDPAGDHPRPTATSEGAQPHSRSPGSMVDTDITIWNAGTDTTVPARVTKKASRQKATPATAGTSAAAMVSAPSVATSPNATVDRAATLASAPRVAVAASDSVTALATPSTPERLRQIVGLTGELGFIAASAIYNIAMEAAAAVGPQAFFGVPYHLATAVADIAATTSQLILGIPVSGEQGTRFRYRYGIGDVLGYFNPAASPAGANDPTISVTPEHPLPIILINGTGSGQHTTWNVGAAVLADAGYKVFSFNYGNRTPYPDFPLQAVADIRISGRQLAAEVDKVLAETGAPKVILVGLSQGGGILPNYYINRLDGAAKVAQLIGISPSNHGTDFDGLLYLNRIPVLGPLMDALFDLIGPAARQQELTSPFQKEVYGDGDTRPDVDYVTITSNTDWVVTPYTQQSLRGSNVTNIVLQDRFPDLRASHIGAAFIPQTWKIIVDALASGRQAAPRISARAA